ncbi:MAG: extracellular solute-binding protein [Defluviitaleaceae bacterium]|nr:extracellular solute-binding protein [Defluviitaleaceae bacterium]MCL2274372.1 extracellular solute-binding protein [Defluviitaleaceae bacterium]
MKNLFRTIITLSAMVAVIFAITACGGGNNDTPPAPTPGTGTTPVATPAPGTGTTPAEPTGDGLQRPDLSGIQGTDIFVFHQSINPNVLQDAADFEALHNVRIRIEDTPWAQYYSRLMSLIMADDAPDIFDSNDEVLPMYALREIAIPIDGLFTPNAPWLDFDVMNGMQWQGQTYILQEVGRVPILMFYNATMFNRYGLPTPMELWQQGDWTVDRMFDLSREFMADIDNTGELNQFGFTATSVYTLFGANQLPITVYDPQAGQFTLAINGPRQLAVLQQAIDRVNSQCIHPFGWHGDIFANGRMAMMGHEAWFANSLLAMEDDWSIAPFPVGPYGDPNFNHIRTWGASVATGARNPLGGVAFVEFQYERNLERGSDFFNQGWMNPAREAGVRAAMDKQSFFSLHNGIPNFRAVADQVTWDINDAAGRTATDIINAQLSAMQSYIDDFNNLIPGWEEPRVFENPGVVDFEDGTMGWLTWEPEEWMNMTRTIIDDGIDGRSLHIEFAEGSGTWVPIVGTRHEDLVFVGGQAYVISFDYHVISLVPDEWHVFYTTGPDMMWSQYEITAGQQGRFEMTVGAEGDHDQKEFMFRINGVREMIIDNFNLVVVEF